MTPQQFHEHIQAQATSFAAAIATKEGDWIVKGFIDIHCNIYSISIDTKIVSKVLELLLFPMFKEFADKYDLEMELSPQQNFYPDLTFRHRQTGNLFAVDVKSTYRKTETEVNGMTLGAFTGYFRNRKSRKNTVYPYGEYKGHFVLGVIYTKCDDVADERRKFTIKELSTIPSVIRDFVFFAHPKYRIATGLPGSGNTKNIGSVAQIESLISGKGPFSELGEEVYDDYWMFYQTNDMAKKLDTIRPYTNIKSYLEYKRRGSAVLTAHEEEIRNLDEEDNQPWEEETE